MGENMQPVPNAGKQVTIAERGENMQPMPNAGKQVIIAELGENKQLFLSAGKNATDTKRGKTSKLLASFSRARLVEEGLCSDCCGRVVCVFCEIRNKSSLKHFYIVYCRCVLTY